MMTHYEVEFKFRHDCAFNRLSRSYPSIVLAWWTNFDQDVLEATCGDLVSPAYRNGLQREVRKMGGHIVRETLSQSRLQFVVSWDGTKWEYSTSRTFMKHSCLVLQPTTHMGGWEWYRVIAFSDRDLKALFRELDSTGEVEVVSKETVDEGTVRDTLKITTSNLLGRLTGNQIKALVLALDGGYYAVPKRVTTEEIATRVGLPRTTFEEHLRKAESKVLQSVAPYMQFSAGTQKNGNRSILRNRDGPNAGLRGLDAVESQASSRNRR
jgi:predicted DNA binding protein